MLKRAGLAAMGVAALLAWQTSGSLGPSVHAAPPEGQLDSQAQQRGRQQAQPPRSAPGQQRSEQARRTAPGQQRQQAQRMPPGQQRNDQAQRQTPPGQQRNDQAQRQTPPGQQRQARQAFGQPRWPAGRPPYSIVEKSLRNLPARFEPIVTSNRPGDRVVLGALAYGAVRGLDVEQLGFTTHPGAVLVTNRRGETLFHLSDDRARSLGAWQMRRLGDQRPRDSAPAFCRSGEGHPVWGREWCLERGFGLGSRNDLIWSRSRVDDIILQRRVESDHLTRDVLLGVLGDVVFHRIAVHSLAVGFVDPLSGTWVAEPGAPHILRVYAGDTAVAELIDTDGDDRIDVLYVVQPY